MKTNEASIFVFIASIIVGIMVSLNINFNRSVERVFMSTKEYQDANNTKNKLLNDISNLQEKYYQYYSKVSKYENTDKTQIQIAQEMQNELLKNEELIGQQAVTGQGIQITLKDGDPELYDDATEKLLRTVHNYDVYNVINDLRNAGAEAISINGQRVIDTTSVFCDGVFLRINNVKVPVPFYISAIGNKEVLDNYMMQDDNTLKSLINRNVYVTLARKDNIKIPGYLNDINVKYMKSKKN